MSDRKTLNAVEGIKTLRSPMARARKQEERTTLYTHDPGNEQSLRYRIPLDFHLTGYIFDLTLPIISLDDDDILILSTALKTDIVGDLMYILKELVLEFLTAYMLQPRIPSEADFLERLDSIRHEIACLRRSLKKLRRLLGRTGRESDLSRTKRGTFSVSQSMRTFLRDCDTNFELDFSTLEYRLEGERMRLEASILKGGRPSEIFLRKFLDALMVELVRRGIQCKLPSNAKRETGSTVKNTPLLEFVLELMNILHAKGTLAVEKSKLKSSEKLEVKTSLNYLKNRSASALMHYIRTALKAAKSEIMFEFTS